MEKTEKELIMQSIALNPLVKKLYVRHKKLEKEVEHMRNYAKYSCMAAMRHAELKKQKLKGKEELLALVTSL